MVKLPVKGLDSPTNMAIFSRLIGISTRPCAFSASVKRRPIAARSIFPSTKALRPAALPLVLNVTGVLAYFAPNSSFRAWLIAAALPEPSIVSLESFGRESGKTGGVAV